MDKQVKQDIGLVIGATALCAAVVIAGIVAVDVSAEQKPVADQTAPVVAEPVVEPEVISYYDSIPLDKELQNYIIEQSHENGIKPQVIMAMIDHESEFVADAIGDDGEAYGLMQIWPMWHYERMQRLGCTDLLDPYQNVTVGLDFICELLNRYDGDITKAVVAFNQGTYNGTITEYAKTVLEKADEIGGANVYEVYG